MAKPPEAPSSLAAFQEEAGGEMELIQKLFERFDPEGTGEVPLDSVPELLEALGRDKDTAVLVQEALKSAASPERASVTFESIISELRGVEEVSADTFMTSTNKGASGSQEAEGRAEDAQPDDGKGEGESATEGNRNDEILLGPDGITAPVLCMKRLDDFRKQCEVEGRYSEARKARQKYDELRRHEEERQRRLVELAQFEEIQEVETAQRQQFLEFSSAWDKYMGDYEAQAYISMEKLKNQHAKDFREYQTKLSDYYQHRCKPKFSRDLLELRQKEYALAKFGRYEEADKAKERADALERWELGRHEDVLRDVIRRKEGKFLRREQLELQALLKRVQRDRAEQIRQRQADSQRLIQRNRNLKVDLLKKQHAESARAEVAIKTILGQNPDVLEELTKVAGEGGKAPGLSEAVRALEARRKAALQRTKSPSQVRPSGAQTARGGSKSGSTSQKGSVDLPPLTERGSLTRTADATAEGAGGDSGSLRTGLRAPPNTLQTALNAVS